MNSGSATVRFLLDENLSPRVARALDDCGCIATHVAVEPRLGRGTADEVIVPWCGMTGRVWVTTDNDARARHMRYQLVPTHGVQAIVITPQPKGIRAQLVAVVANIDEWEIELSSGHHGVWVQRERGRLKRL